MASRYDAIPELDTELRSSEVGAEGGSPGDVEFYRRCEAGYGSEAGETWRPRDHNLHEVRRDHTGIGRRSPVG